MVKVTQVTKNFFITDSDDKIYFKKPLEETPTIEDMQEFLDKKEKDIKRLLDYGEDN